MGLNAANNNLLINGPGGGLPSLQNNHFNRNTEMQVITDKKKKTGKDQLHKRSFIDRAISYNMADFLTSRLCCIENYLQN